MKIAKYVRIFEPDPQDDFIKTREKAINALRTRLLRKRNLSELIATGSGICEGFFGQFSIPDGLIKQIEGELKKYNGSFVGTDRDLELTVCATASVIKSIISNTNATIWNGWSVSDTLAASVWSGSVSCLHATHRNSKNYGRMLLTLHDSESLEPVQKTESDTRYLQWNRRMEWSLAVRKD